MGIRKVAASRGAGWITDGIAVFSRQPGAYVQACLLIGLISSLPLVGILFGLAMPIFYGGLLSLLRRQATGGVASPGQAFDGFQQPGALARLLPIVLVNLAVAIVFVVLVAVVVGAAVYQLLQSGQSLEANPELLLGLWPKFAALLAVLLPVGIVFGWILMLAIPRAMLDDVPGMAALGEAWAAVRANLLPLFVNLLCLMLVMSVVVLIMILPFAAITLLQQRSPALGILLQIPVAAVFTAVILVVYCAIMYQAWAEIFGPETDAPAHDQVMV
jgi:hypothetical protein